MLNYVILCVKCAVSAHANYCSDRLIWLLYTYDKDYIKHKIMTCNVFSNFTLAVGSFLKMHRFHAKRDANAMAARRPEQA